MVLCRIIENLEQRAGWGANDIVDVAGDKKEDDEKDGASECADADAVDHDLGAFDSSVGNFYQGQRLEYLMSKVV